MNRAAVELLARILQGPGRGTTPHLVRLAGQLGVRAVRMNEELRGIEGRTIFGVGGPVVELCPARHPDWRRVTLAHELVHVLLSRHDLYVHMLGERGDTGGIEEEILCDAVAQALLVPESAVARLNVLTLVEAAKGLGVPVPVVIRRARTLHGLGLPLVVVQRRGEGWRLLRAEGWPDHRVDLLTVCDWSALAESLVSAHCVRVRLQWPGLTEMEATLGARETIVGVATDTPWAVQPARRPHRFLGASGRMARVAKVPPLTQDQ